jgi:predicted amidophosphoribosyltransferase
MKYFCPNCHAEIQQEIIVCPVCIFRVDQWDELNYNQMLIMAIQHKEIFTKLRAVFLLGERKTTIAFEGFESDTIG